MRPVGAWRTFIERALAGRRKTASVESVGTVDVDKRLVEIDGAGELYFRYDASHFGMDRDGYRQEFLAAQVPPALESKWRQEVIDVHLARLARTDDWWSLYVLHQLSVTDHPVTALRAREPADPARIPMYDTLGQLVGWAGAAKLSTPEVQEALHSAIANARQWLAKLDEAASNRLAQVIERLVGMCVPGSGERGR